MLTVFQKWRCSQNQTVFPFIVYDILTPLAFGTAVPVVLDNNMAPSALVSSESCMLWFLVAARSSFNNAFVVVNDVILPCKLDTCALPSNTARES